MNLSMKLKATVLTAATLGVLGGLGQAVATTATGNQVTASAQTLLAQVFSNREVDQSKFLVTAVPGPTLNPHPLFIVEQRAASPACFREINPGSEPTEIDPLWTTFDYSVGNVCGVNKDSNGYGLWLGGEDAGVGWNFKIDQAGDELILRASKTGGKPITIGHSYGMTASGYTKIFLNDGWRLTQRVDNASGRNLSFVYFTNELTVAQLQSGEGDVAVTPPSTRPQPPTQPTYPFNDISGNPYAADITRASELGIMSGYYEDGTFRPTNPLTREQAVSVVMEAVYINAPAGVVSTLPQQVFNNPFPDVDKTRWSAVKINQAKSLGIVTGDFGTGNYRPTDNVSRAELMAMLDKAARLQAQIGFESTNELVPNTTPINFTDISGHWAEAVIKEMSGYCGVATPLNERGTNFAPDSNALRDFTAAAAVRLTDCPAARPQS